MIKIAKNTTPDPIQVKLRQNKKLWNKEVSSFINNLINLKKTMNGAPSSYHPERSTIKDPIPADPSSIINELTSDFQQLAQKGNSLIQEQINYSKNRRKSKSKSFNSTTIEKPINLSDQLKLSELESKYQLVAEGSNFLSRFIARLTNPRIGFSAAAKIRRDRMDLLTACVNTYKILGKMQVEVVKSSKESITSADRLLHEAWNQWTLVSRGFNAYKITMPPSIPDDGGEIAKPKEIIEENKNVKSKIEENKNVNKTEVKQSTELSNPLDEEEKKSYNDDPTILAAKAACKDYNQNYMNIKKSLGDNEGFEKLIFEFQTSIKKQKLILANKVLEEYKNLIDQLNQKLQTNGISLKNIFTEFKSRKEESSKLSPAQAQLEITAQNFAKKWIGKTLHKLNPFDVTSSARINIYELADHTRKTIDQIMNSLEKGMNVEELNNLIIATNKYMTSLRGMMRSLHLTNPTGKNVKETSFFDNFDNII